jgi:hypothetical protein
VTGAGLPSACACARHRPSGAVRDLRRTRSGALCELPGLADPARSPRLRPLRVARAVAGPALRRVRGPAARVLGRPRRHRLRRACTSTRSSLEGARAAPPRARGGGARRGGRSGPRGRLPRARAGRPRTSVAPRGRSCPCTRKRARADLDASDARRARAHPVAPSPARALARRAPPQRARERRRARDGPEGGLHRRRRVHVGGHRRRLRGGVSSGGHATGPRCDLRAGRSLD